MFSIFIYCDVIAFLPLSLTFLKTFLLHFQFELMLLHFVLLSLLLNNVLTYNKYFKTYYYLKAPITLVILQRNTLGTLNSNRIL